MKNMLNKMELNKKEIKKGILDGLDILFVPGGTYRWIKKETKESEEEISKLEKGALNYVVAPGLEVLKTINIGLIGYFVYELIK